MTKQLLQLSERGFVESYLTIGKVYDCIGVFQLNSERIAKGVYLGQIVSHGRKYNRYMLIRKMGNMQLIRFNEYEFKGSILKIVNRTNGLVKLTHSEKNFYETILKKSNI